jgi:putative ABC transport system permease protein
MPVILRIALRNLREHKSKTIIVGTIIAVGIMVMTIGTSLIDTATVGIEKNFIENYTGDILIGGISEDELSIFGVQSIGGIEPTPQLPEYERILSHLASRKDIEVFTPQISGFATITVEGQPDIEKRGVTFLFGIEPDSYQRMFDQISVTEGAFPESGQPGILLAQSNRRRIEKQLEVELAVGDSLLLTGFSDAGIKIREVEIQGFYQLLSETEGIGFSSYIDLPTLRALKAMNVGGYRAIAIEARRTELLDATDLDALFNDDIFNDDGFGTDSFNENVFSSSLPGDIFTSVASDGTDDFLNPFAGGTQGSSSSDSLHIETSAKENAQPPIDATTGSENPFPLLNDGGGYEFIVLSLVNARRTTRVVQELNLWFEQEGIAAQAMDWKGAAGPFSSTADVVRTVFNVAVLLVAFVALIIITNTLLISVMERKKEIGTMRAIGAGKSFVAAMFTAEITVLSLVFGIIGQLGALGVLGIVTLIQIPAGNSLVEILFAGPVLRPVVNLSTLAVDLTVVVVIGILANIYPVLVALKIQPVKAISSI